jgi:DNA-binding LacI/PurR family transcriptional regulator
MNNPGTISEAKKQKVRAVMQRTKWTPNLDARNLAR